MDSNERICERRIMINDEKVAITLSLPHQLTKLVLGTIVGFGAHKLTEKVYDKAIEAIRQRKSA
jgi:hypothetical protein